MNCTAALHENIRPRGDPTSAIDFKLSFVGLKFQEQSHLLVFYYDCFIENLLVKACKLHSAIDSQAANQKC